jgi:hypothetical protein
MKLIYVKEWGHRDIGGHRVEIYEYEPNEPRINGGQHKYRKVRYLNGGVAGYDTDEFRPESLAELRDALRRD